MKFVFVQGEAFVRSCEGDDFPTLSILEGGPITTLGERIRERRKAMRLTQVALGEKLGVTQGAVHEWERGLHGPRRRRMADLASALETTVQWLEFGGDGTSAPIPEPSEVRHAGVRAVPNAEPGLTDIPVYEINILGPEDRHIVKNVIEWTMRPVYLAGVTDAYAVRIAGNRMEPRYHLGEMVLCHPRKPIAPGPQSYVLVWFVTEDGEDRNIVARYARREGNNHVFEWLNPPTERVIPTVRLKSIDPILGTRMN